MSRFQSDEPVFPDPRAPAEAGTPDSIGVAVAEGSKEPWTFDALLAWWRTEPTEGPAFLVAPRVTRETLRWLEKLAGTPLTVERLAALLTELGAAHALNFAPLSHDFARWLHARLATELRGAASPSAGPSPEPPLGVTHWQDVAADVLRLHHPSYDVDCRETLCACGMRFKAGEEPSWERHAALFVLKALPRVPAISGPWPPSPTAAAQEWRVVSNGQIGAAHYWLVVGEQDTVALRERSDALAVRDALNRVAALGGSARGHDIQHCAAPGCGLAAHHEGPCVPTARGSVRG